jgi:hypothetical protein
MTTPTIKSTATPPYEVCAYHTRTGRVARWLPLAAQPTWERGLNIAGSWSVSVSLDPRFLTKDELNGVSTEWDWSWAIVQGPHIWQAGPVKTEEYDDSGNDTTIAGGGLLQVLVERRVLVNAARDEVGVISGIDADFAFGTSGTSEKGAPIPADRQNLALQTVIKRLVENALDEPGGDLPIDVPSEEYTGVTERAYPGYELGMVGQRILEITQLDNGPEIELVPYFTSTAREFVRHRLLTGTPDNNGRLGNLTYPHVWDSGKGLVRLPYSRSGDQRTARDWEKGTGTDRAIVVGFDENLDGVTTGPGAGSRPLLETVGTTHTQASELDTLNGYAAGSVVNGSRGTLTLKATIRTDGFDGQGKRTRSPRLIEVRPGDTGIFNVTRHRRLPDGLYEIRILRIRGTSALNEATVDCQLLSGGGVL